MEDLSTNLSNIDDQIEEFNEAEYEAQYFGFPTRAFTDGMYNAIHDYTRSSLNEAQELLFQKHADVMTEEQVKGGSESILQHLTAFLNKAIDKLEIYLMKNVFHIPEHVILPEDFVHKNSHSVEEHNSLYQEIDNLKEKIIETQRRKALLKQELEDQKIIKEKLVEFSNYLDKIREIAKSNGIDNLKDSYINGINKANELATAVVSLEEADMIGIFKNIA